MDLDNRKLFDEKVKMKGILQDFNPTSLKKQKRFYYCAKTHFSELQTSLTFLHFISSTQTFSQKKLVIEN